MHHNVLHNTWTAHKMSCFFVESMCTCKCETIHPVVRIIESEQSGVCFVCSALLVVFAAA